MWLNLDCNFYLHIQKLYCLTTNINLKTKSFFSLSRGFYYLFSTNGVIETGPFNPEGIGAHLVASNLL